MRNDKDIFSPSVSFLCQGRSQYCGSLPASLPLYFILRCWCVDKKQSKIFFVVIFTFQDKSHNSCGIHGYHSHQWSATQNFTHQVIVQINGRSDVCHCFAMSSHSVLVDSSYCHLVCSLAEAVLFMNAGKGEKNNLHLQIMLSVITRWQGDSVASWRTVTWPQFIQTFVTSHLVVQIPKQCIFPRQRTE